MKKLLLPALSAFCISCSNSKTAYTPPKKEIKGIITERSDRGAIPLTGATIYVVNKDSIKSVDEEILRNYNLMRYCYYNYLHFKEINGHESASEILESIRGLGVYDEATYKVAEKKAFDASVTITTNPNTKTTTVNPQGAYSITVDSGSHIILISLPGGTNFYGSTVITTDAANDFSKSLYDPR